MADEKRKIPPEVLVALIAGLITVALLAWMVVFAYKTLLPKKKAYDQRLAATVDFMVGRQAADLGEAAEILAQADELLRVPNSDQRKYNMIKSWLNEFHDGIIDEWQMQELINKNGGPKMNDDPTAVINDGILRAYNIMHIPPPTSKLPEISIVAGMMKTEMEKIEKANNSDFNKELDALRKGLENGETTLEAVNAFLAGPAAERARHTTIMNLTISAQRLIDMLDDDNEKKRTVVYEALLRIFALAESGNITTTEPTDAQIEEIRAKFDYDPAASPEARGEAVEKIREWTRNGINKDLYPE